MSVLPGESQLIGSSDPIFAVEGDDVILPCSLEPPIDAEFLTVAWTRSDLPSKYVHYYRDGRNSEYGKNPFYRYRTKLFEDELVRGNVSLKLSRVKLEDEGSYTCRVGQVRTIVIQLSVGKENIHTEFYSGLFGGKKYSLMSKCGVFIHSGGL